MLGLLRFVSDLSYDLGRFRLGVRRIASLCLIVLAVHAAADTIDDAVFAALDRIDQAVDAGLDAAVRLAARARLIDPRAAAALGERLAGAIGLEEKVWLALRVALAMEFALDMLLLAFTWGNRDDPDAEPVGRLAELMDQVRGFILAFRHLDLERVALLPTMIALTLSGSLSAALAASGATQELLSRLMSGRAEMVAAAVGVTSAAMLLVRFLPDLLEGAMRQSHNRAVMAEAGGGARHHHLDERQRLGSVRSVWLRRLSIRLRVRLRGAWVLVLALPLALVSLRNQGDFLVLLRRLGFLA